MSLIEFNNPPCLKCGKKPCECNNEIRCGSCQTCDWCIDNNENGTCVQSDDFTPENCPYSFNPGPDPRPHHHRHHRRHPKRDWDIIDDDSNDNAAYNLNAIITIILIIIVLIILLFIYFAV